MSMKLPIAEAAQKLDVSIDTLRRWDKLGVIRADRDSKGRRTFDVLEVRRLQNKRNVRAAGDRTLFRNPKLPTANLTSIDLFAGGGGTALGLENAGFDHLLLSEIDQHAAQTLRNNRPNWDVREGDVADIDFTPYRGEVDLLEGGFPCQAFSYAGNSKGFGDPRGTLFFEFARAIMESHPKAFVGENVRGLLQHDGGRTFETMLATLKSIRDPETGLGYKIGFKVLKAQYFDVPQKRERLILVGLREDIDAPLLLPKERDYTISLWEAIGDKPKSDGAAYPAKKHRILDLVPPGGYWRDLPEDLQREYLGGSYHLSGGKTGMARRLAWDEPSLTLTCAPAQKQTERCHPEETRPLNVREYARIQTFPDDWKFSGRTTHAYKQIGNAVPVNLGFHIGTAVRAMLTGDNLEDFEELKVL
ncbi:DNA (cytosine-5-)-methyltransferase [Glutamicibacter mysorens]|uniref:DNA (cytosine-5-)-methyltransferase n=1 Tax=Glutamicibacter mysorens TaxID=257984 RepID=UPI0020C5D324|nr:DNA (cytosine-5-)-methyltransferase [Glutamicibacter mysorens]UTM45925.1 DNA (cytosine-5-)-methyltransferase [Glutamicibacter mysorens]